MSYELLLLCVNAVEEVEHLWRWCRLWLSLFDDVVFPVVKAEFELGDE